MFRLKGTTRLGIGIVTVALLGVSWALAEFTPVLHERFEPDPQEDLALGVRVTSARLPAALTGPSGPVAVPNPTAPVDRAEPTYGERNASAPPRFRIDRQTTDPGRLSYHEPFRPSIAPFKRTHVFDTVDADFDLAVSDARLRPVTLVTSPGKADDQFFGDLVLDLVPGDWIRIPSVGAHMAIYSAHLEPEAPFGFYADRAENWFVRTVEGRGARRLVMHVGVARAFFDGRIEAASYAELVTEMPKLAPNVEQATAQVLARLGITRVLSPADALSELVTYFRGFAEASDPPKAAQGEALYRELVLTRKGVCRHRAYAFVVTSLGLGIPAHFVHNEAHAWVEVFGGRHWHRIDLGGAASGIDYRGTPPVGPAHRAPPEAFAWPKHDQSAARSLPIGSQLPSDGSQSAGPPSTVAPGSSTSNAPAAVPSTAAAVPNGMAPAQSGSVSPSTAQPASSTATAALSSPATEGDKPRGTARIVAALTTPTAVTRGDQLGLSGRIEASDGRCDMVRVDAALTAQNRRHPIGSFVTDADGKFATQLAVPTDLNVGDYNLILSTPGSAKCPPASTE